MTGNLLQDKDLQYAYQSLHDFFDCFGVAKAVVLTEQLLQAAAGLKPWRKGEAASLLTLKDKLKELVSAVFVIINCDDRNDKAILAHPAGPDLTQAQQYISKLNSCTVWQSFPRSLTVKQYNNPHKALKKFTVFMPEKDWLEILQLLTEYALSNVSFNEYGLPHNLLTLRRRLLQLIEASHLIVARNLEKGGVEKDH